MTILIAFFLAGSAFADISPLPTLTREATDKNFRDVVEELRVVDPRDGADITGPLSIASATTFQAVSSTTFLGTVLISTSVTVTSTITAANFAVSCPAAFTAISAKGQQLGCMQTAEEGSITNGNVYIALQDCWDTYGARLPTPMEWYLAMNNYALTDETDDPEITDDMNSSTFQYACMGNGGLTDHASCAFDNCTAAYRCFIPR